MKLIKSILLVLNFAITAANAQLITDSLLIDGHYRSFHFSDPGKARKPSLMFVMHGSGGNGKDMMRSAVSLEKNLNQSIY